MDVSDVLQSIIITYASEHDTLAFHWNRLLPQVSQEKGSGRKRAVEVVLVRTNRERREEEQLKKVSQVVLRLALVPGPPSAFPSRPLTLEIDAYPVLSSKVV